MVWSRDFFSLDPSPTTWTWFKYHAGDHWFEEDEAEREGELLPGAERWGAVIEAHPAQYAGPWMRGRCGDEWTWDTPVVWDRDGVRLRQPH